MLARLRSTLVVRQGYLLGAYAQFLALATATYAFPATASAQGAAGTKAEDSKAQLSISIETGRYDPAPGCKKDVDGCFPKVWTSTSTFSLGTRVWIRATLVNRSGLTAYAEVYPELPPVQVDLVEERTGNRPSLTRAGCRLRPNTCAPAQDDPAHGELILGGPHGAWIMPPGTSSATMVEITGQFVLSKPGEYGITAESGVFDLTAKDNIDIDGPIDKAATKSSNRAQSEPVHFVVVAH